MNAIQADATAPASITAISTSQPGWCGRAPVANARRAVRFISRSLSNSTYWLYAPALADAVRTDSASTSTCNQVTEGPGVITMPTRAVIMMSTPMRSLKSEMTSRATCATPRSVT